MRRLVGTRAIPADKLRRYTDPIPLAEASPNHPAHAATLPMPREPIIQEDAPAGDDEDRRLRPQRMNDMVGQRAVIERLRIAIEAALQRDEALGHVLLDGPPGLGKTTFAQCMHRELGTSMQITSGAILTAPKDLIPYLTGAETKSILFIDEIHRLPKGVEEYLYTAMEDFRIDLVLGEGVNARTYNLRLKQFTLIGATTRAGMLSGPLRDRFLIREHLGFYTESEIAEIVIRSAGKLQVFIDAESAAEIARRSRNTPRMANRHLRWVRDYAQSRADGRIVLATARAALELAGIDELGLDSQDRRYIRTVIRAYLGKPVGIQSIAATMNVSVDTLLDEVEPFLLRIEMIVRTPQGRLATAKAYEHLKLTSPGADDPQGKLF
jgi:Holliday junction DNA helicase RuvB